MHDQWESKVGFSGCGKVATDKCFFGIARFGVERNIYERKEGKQSRLALFISICAGGRAVFPESSSVGLRYYGGGSSTVDTGNAAVEEPATDEIFGTVNDVPIELEGEGEADPSGDGPASVTGDDQEEGTDEVPSTPEETPATDEGDEAAEPLPQRTAPLQEDEIGDEGISPQADGAGDFTVTGGTAGTDYSFDAATGILHILTSKPLTIANTDPATATGNSIQVDAGVYANITFNNVNINAAWPLEISTGGTANIILADGSTNNLVCSMANLKAPAIHCGTGANLIIDDAVVNKDTAGNPITPQDGEIPAGITYVANDGKTHTSTGDYLTLLDSKNPGYLFAHGGGQGAAIGGAYGEDGGNMTFNGGTISVLNGKGPLSEGMSGGEHGAGIGGGGMAAGTSPSEWIVFNGGTVHTEAAFHGAGVGGGWNNSTPGTYTSAHPAGTGNIRINGGYVRSVGGKDGNGFGRGCYGGRVFCDNRDYAIVITGGTMIPSGGTNLGQWGNDIGGGGTRPGSSPPHVAADLAAAVVITGGSIKVSTADGRFRFDGTAYGDFEEVDGKIVPDTSKPLEMITINLTADLKLLAPEGQEADLNCAVTSWRLLVNGIESAYGAPSIFDEGNLYLWLPEEDAKKQVTVDLSYLGPNGEIIPVEPLYREPGSTEKLKRYVYFTLEPNFFTDPEGKTSTVTVPYDQLDLEEQRKVTPDANGNAVVSSVTKPYDGLSYSVRELTADDPLNSGGNDNKDIYNNISYICQAFDPETKKLGEQVTSANMPEDAGLSRFILESKQYSDSTVDKDFADSYWGHRAYGWCEITPVDPAIVSLEASWFDKNGNLVDPDEKNTVMNTLKLVADITSAEGTANTCKAPTGWVQLVVDGKKVGDPIELIYDGTNANTVKTTTKAGARVAQSAPARQMLSAASAAAPAFAAAMPVALDDNQPVATADTWNDGYDGTREHGIFTISLNATDPGCDWLLPNATKDNKHTVSLEYIPAKNYNPTEGLAADKKPKVDIEAEPVTPETKTEVEGDGVIEEPVPPQPGDGENRIERHKLSYNYKDPKKDTGAVPDPNWNVIKVKVNTPSSGDFKVTTSNGAVATAEVLRDDDGNPIRDADGNVTLVIKVDSAGETTITIEQEPNGVYYGSTFIYDLTVEPDVTIPPETSLVKTAKNLTHDGDYIRPGDIIEYTITAANAAKGSVWQFPYVQDQLPETVELIPGSLKLTNTSMGIMTAKVLDESEYTFENGKITVPLTRVYGGQNAQLTFQAKVKEGLTGRDTPAELKSVANDAQAQGYTGMENEPLPGGGYKPPDDPGNPFDDEDTPDDPDDSEDPDNPDTPGTDPDPDDPKPPVTDPDAPKKTPVVETEEPGKPTVDIIIPNNVQKGDITVAKTAENLTRKSGSTQVGDKIRYSITVKNVKPDSVWCDTVIKDELPVGIEPVPNTFQLKNVAGDMVAVPDAVYNAQARTVALSCGNLYGGESYVLIFEAVVTEDAIGKDIGNVAEVFGTQPTDKLPKPEDLPKDPSTPGEGDGPDNPNDPDNPDNPDNPDDPNNPGGKPTKPNDPTDLENGTEEGTPFWPEEGWDEYEKNHTLPIDVNNPAGGTVSASSGQPAYPLPNDAIEKSIADPNGGKGDGADNGVNKKLPKTGDDSSVPATAAVLGMMVALAVAVVAHRRKNEALHSRF